MHGAEAIQTSGATRHWLRPARAQDLPILEAQAKADGHALIAPSHVFERRGELVGYVSLGVVPLMLPWFDTKRCQGADSLYYINCMENLAAALMPAASSGLVCVPVMAGSPFEPFIQKLGYVNAGQATLALKKVN
jgi:hypothetical protein